MYLKIMSGENLPDGDHRKSFHGFDFVRDAWMKREADGARVEVLFVGGERESYPCEGNCYLMNAEGVTVMTYYGRPAIRAAA